MIKTQNRLGSVNVGSISKSPGSSKYGQKGQRLKILLGENKT